jgi:hypothetical protein
MNVTKDLKDQLKDERSRHLDAEGRLLQSLCKARLEMEVIMVSANSLHMTVMYYWNLLFVPHHI